MDYNYIKETLLAEELSRVKDMIVNTLDTDIDLLNKTNQSILDSPGKMIRPVLALLVAKACGVLSDDTIRFAVAAELIHNASLLHDDVADNSASRRGKPTVMALLGGKASVLLGDFWLVKAVDKLINAERNKVEVLSLFSQTLLDLAEGEMLQLEKAQKCDTQIEDYFRIIYDKTASLFVSTAEAAAISVGASAVKIEAVKAYAKHMGIAFQIKDDILDYAGDKSLGKPLGQDLQEAKITMPLFAAFEQAGQYKEKEYRDKLSQILDKPEYQAEIVQFVLDNKGIELAEQALNRELDKAKASLSLLEDTEAKEALLFLVDFMISRNK